MYPSNLSQLFPELVISGKQIKASLPSLIARAASPPLEAEKLSSAGS